MTEETIDLSKLGRSKAIEIVKGVLGCTRQQAEEFVDLAQGRTTGDIIRGGEDEEESGARRSKEAGGGAQARQLWEDGEGDGGSPDGDEAGGNEAAHGGQAEAEG